MMSAPFFLYGSTPEYKFSFLYQIQGFPQFQLPLAMLWKCELRSQIECVIVFQCQGRTCRFYSSKGNPLALKPRVKESWREQISRLVKQTSSIQAKFPFGIRFDKRVCGFFNSRLNDQKRLQWAVLLWYKPPGVYTDQIHRTLSWHSIEMTTAM